MRYNETSLVSVQLRHPTFVVETSVKFEPGWIVAFMISNSRWPIAPAWSCGLWLLPLAWSLHL